MRLSLVYKPLNQADEYYVRDLYDIPAEQAATIVEDFEEWSNQNAETRADDAPSAVETYQYQNTDEGETAVAAIDFRPLVAIHGG
jgi:hypothetical protein